jgi:hypothetical protein
MRARLHPGAIVGAWAYTAGFALLASWPAASLAAASSGGDRGDVRLWAEGGHFLLNVLSLEAHGVASSVRAAGLVVAVAIVGAQIPTAALMACIAYAMVPPAPAGAMLANPAAGRAGRLGPVAALTAALRAFRPFALLLVLSVTAQAVLLGAGYGLARLAETLAYDSLGEARAQLLAAAVAAIALACAWVLGVAHDLGRASVILGRTRPVRALLEGVRALRRSPGGLLGSCAWRTTAGAAPVLAMAAWTPLAPSTTSGLLLVALVHQAMALVRASLRASWLALALRTLAERS